MAGGGSAYDDRVVRARIAQAFGRLIRREGDRGVFVILSAAMPSRLLQAFPARVPVRRVPLDVAIARVEEFLPATGSWQTREAGVTEGGPSTTELALGGPPPRSGEDL
jgi:ATP-dependent DNA helicase DinG